MSVRSPIALALLLPACEAEPLDEPPVDPGTLLLSSGLLPLGLGVPYFNADQAPPGLDDVGLCLLGA